MNPDRIAYEREIRDYLLARLGRHPRAGTIAATRVDELPTLRALDWWIFEGRRYRGLEDCLARSWDHVARQIRQLEATYNPHWRAVQAPEGEVDWVATAFLTATSQTPEFKCKTSRVGLSPEERVALRGWQAWIATRWAEYVSKLGVPDGSSEQLPWEVPADGSATLAQIRRWAYTARRSRWPLLRTVVAESLRSVFEPVTLDSLPLPSDHPTLFELLCLVRVLRALEPSAPTIRWLDPDASANEVRIPGVVCQFQRSIGSELMLATPEFDHGLREAVLRHAVRTPRSADLFFQLARPIAGFSSLLIEAKSGSQTFGAATYQLKCYRAALKQESRGPMIVWGITEAEPADGDNRSAIESLAGVDGLTAKDDLWVFSAASEIQAVLETLGLAKGRLAA